MSNYRRSRVPEVATSSRWWRMIVDRSLQEMSESLCALPCKRYETSIRFFVEAWVLLPITCTACGVRRRMIRLRLALGEIKRYTGIILACQPVRNCGNPLLVTLHPRRKRFRAACRLHPLEPGEATVW